MRRGGAAPNPSGGRGQFQKGQSGNPGGRSRVERQVFGNLAVEARRYGRAALDQLVQLMKHGPPNVRYMAAIAILDRGFGRPTQSIDLHTDAANVQVNFFESLGLDDPGRLERDLAKVIELKAVREKELEQLAKPDDIVDVEEPGE
jgi:hypothetical protein